MATKRRPSPTEEDLRRFVETLHTNNPNIWDMEDFEKEWEDYFTGDEPAESLKFRKDLQIEAFKMYAEEYDLPLEREKKKIKKGYKIISHTREGRPITRPPRNLNVIARTKGRVVYASKEYVTIKGKQQVRYRNKKGQFSSVPKERRVLA